MAAPCSARTATTSCSSPPRWRRGVSTLAPLPPDYYRTGSSISYYVKRSTPPGERGSRDERSTVRADQWAGPGHALAALGRLGLRQLRGRAVRSAAGGGVVV